MLMLNYQDYYANANSTKTDLSPRHWDTGLVSSASRVSLILWGESASLTFVSYPCSEGITIKISYGIDVLLHRPVSHSIFSYWVG